MGVSQAVAAHLALFFALPISLDFPLLPSTSTMGFLNSLKALFVTSPESLASAKAVVEVRRWSRHLRAKPERAIVDEKQSSGCHCAEQGRGLLQVASLASAAPSSATHTTAGADYCPPIARYCPYCVRAKDLLSRLGQDGNTKVRCTPRIVNRPPDRPTCGDADATRNSPQTIELDHDGNGSAVQEYLATRINAGRVTVPQVRLSSKIGDARVDGTSSRICD